MKQAKYPICTQPIFKGKVARFVEVDSLTAAVYAPQPDGDLPSDIAQVIAGINDPVLAAFVSERLMQARDSELGTDNIEDAEFYTRGRFESSADYAARLYNRLSELQQAEKQEE